MALLPLCFLYGPLFAQFSKVKLVLTNEKTRTKERKKHK